jgi:hypothetical protein
LPVPLLGGTPYEGYYNKLHGNSKILLIQTYVNHTRIQ